MFFLLLLLGLFSLSVMSSLAWRRYYLEQATAEPAYALPPRAAPLHGQPRENATEICFSVAEKGLSYLADLKEAQHRLHKSDRTGAGRKIELGLVSGEELLAELKAYPQQQNMDEETAEWLDHAHACTLESTGLAEEAMALCPEHPPKAKLRLTEATRLVEEVLLAAHDFADGPLRFNLEEEIEESMGALRLELFLSAVSSAERRM